MARKVNIEGLREAYEEAAENLNKATEAEMHATNMRKTAQAKYESALDAFNRGVSSVHGNAVIQVKLG